MVKHFLLPNFHDVFVLMLSRTACAAILFLLLPLGALADIVDRSVAIVNNDTITLSEVNELGQSLFKKVAAEAPAAQRESMLQEARRAVIEKLIEKKLLLQEAKKLKLQVSDQDVENAFQRVIANNKLTEEQFRKEIAAEGMSEKQYREGLHEQILHSKLINHAVRTKIVIPESAALDYYNTHYISMPDSEYHLLQIGCAWGIETKNGIIPSQDEARQKAEKAHSLATQGKDFKDLAKEYSDLPSAADGGDLGHFQQDELAPYIRDVILSLKSGEVSRITETENAYHFFKILSIQDGQTVAREPFDTVKDQIREKLYQQALDQKFKDWLISIQEKAYIKVL
jgi:Parvulin-like peptidyl-prolyl isomerase